MLLSMAYHGRQKYYPKDYIFIRIASRSGKLHFNIADDYTGQADA